MFPATFWLNESAVLRVGRPFYVPEWDSDFRLFPMLALRVDKVGKGMPARFAERYIGHASLWLHARGMETLAKLSEASLPLGSALGFDGALISAPFLPVSLSQVSGMRFMLTVDKSEYQIAPEAGYNPETILEAIASRNTMRTGDILLLPCGDGIPAVRGTRITVTTLQPEQGLLTSFPIK